jgi:predicted enzyme related to lactoylglutathione lyase
MASRISHTSFDAVNAYAQSVFWSQVLADHRRPDGSGWITLADPEGNEFCILSRDPAGSGPTT